MLILIAGSGTTFLMIPVCPALDLGFLFNLGWANSVKTNFKVSFIFLKTTRHQL